jgi:DeoR/GlpR family transcriptional regulator of sugar metabolism
MLKGITRSLIGPPAEDFFQVLQVDKLFLATGGVSIEKNTLTNPNMHEKSVKRKMMETAAEIILVADSNKFEKPALYSFGNLNDVDRVITDENLPADYKQRIEELGPEVVIGEIGDE